MSLEYNDALFELIDNVCKKDYLCDDNITGKESLLLENESIQNNKDFKSNGRYVENLTDGQKKAIESYTEWNYIMINRVGGSTDEALLSEFGQHMKKDITAARADAAILDDIIDRAPTNKRGIFVFRGINFPIESIATELEACFDNVGVRSKSFASTSIYPSSPLESIYGTEENNNWKSTDEKPWCCLLIIYIPVGNKFIYLPDLSDFREEQEILLSRYNKYRIIRKDKLFIRKPHMDASGAIDTYIDVLIIEICPSSGARQRMGGARLRKSKRRNKSKGKITRKSKKKRRRRNKRK